MRILFLAILCFAVTTVQAQTQNDRASDNQFNAITTAVPFLNIAPDSRSSALGDAGTALSPDASSIHWNAAKLAFAEDDFGLAISYLPWLRAIVPDMNIAYISGFKKLNETSAFAGSVRYFSLGKIIFTDESGTNQGNFTPSEFALDGAYSLKLSDYFGAGVALRFIYSNLTGGNRQAGSNTKPGTTAAFDASVYYQSKKFDLSDKNALFRAGLTMSNVGGKMTYNTGGATDKNFLPANLRLGTGLTLELDQYNKVTFLVEASKLLVPTPGGSLDDSTTANVDVSVASAVFGSFSDAPGGGKEELQEVNLGLGIEYDYDGKLQFRAGFFNEPEVKGNRQFISLGAGLAYSSLKFDFSYLLATKQNSPLANTLRITIGFKFDKTSGGDDQLPSLN